jgi:hypothetical protein
MMEVINMVKKIKVLTKTHAQNSKLLEKVPAEYVFWCHDGSVFTDVNELATGLMNMSDDTFAYHSNAEKHDFSNWVRDVIGDEDLADNLERATSRLQAAEYIAARLDELAMRQPG